MGMMCLEERERLSSEEGGGTSLGVYGGGQKHSKENRCLITDVSEAPPVWGRIALYRSAPQHGWLSPMSRCVFSLKFKTLSEDKHLSSLVWTLDWPQPNTSIERARKTTTPRAIFVQQDGPYYSYKLIPVEIKYWSSHDKANKACPIKDKQIVWCGEPSEGTIAWMDGWVEWTSDFAFLGFEQNYTVNFSKVLHRGSVDPANGTVGKSRFFISESSFKFFLYRFSFRGSCATRGHGLMLLVHWHGG